MSSRAPTHDPTDGAARSASISRCSPRELSFEPFAESNPITAPALAIGGFGGPFTADTLGQVATGTVESMQLDGVGHYVAQEAPEALAQAILAFTERI